MFRTTLGVATLAALLAAALAVRPGGPPQAAAQPPAKAGDLPADLALVPADAVGFVHVRLADLWKNDLFREVRKTWLAAGDETLKALDEQFVPAPSSLDRVTVFVLPDPGGKHPRLFGVIAFSAPFDREKLVKAYLPEAKTRQVSGRTVYTPRGNSEIAVTFPDDWHVLIGASEGMDGYLSKPPAKDGPLAGALKLATARPVVAAANLSAIPIQPDALFEPLKGLPVDLRPVFKAELVLLAVDLGSDAKIEVKATYPDEAAARAAEDSVRALVAEGRKKLAAAKKELGEKLHAKDAKTPRPPDQLPEAVMSVFGIGVLNRIDALLADPRFVTRDGKNLALTLSMPREVVAMAGLLGPPLLGFGLFSLASPLRGLEDAFGGSNLKSQNNLKQIGLAIHSYHDVHGKFPADITDKDGKPLLSWRVAILPYLEQDNLYKQFKLDEPWDSEHNRKLSQQVVKVFESPNVKARKAAAKEGEKPFGQTDYLGVSGPGTMFDPTGEGLTFAGVTDGLSNTVMVVETGDPVPWAKPGDLVIDPKKPLPKLSAAGMDGVTNVLLGDGSVRKVDTRKVSEKTLRNAFLRNDGMPLGPDW
jgi:hypothetical protein